MNCMMNDIIIETLIKLQQERVERETRYNRLNYNEVKQTNKPALACNLLCALGRILIRAGEKLHEIAGETSRLQHSSSNTLMPKAG